MLPSTQGGLSNDLRIGWVLVVECEKFEPLKCEEAAKPAGRLQRVSRVMALA